MFESSAELLAEARRRAGAAGRRRAAAAGSSEWPELAPPTGLADGPLGAVQAADRQLARLTAARARAVAAFAATRPASADRGPGEPGAMSAERAAARPAVLGPVSEWATAELAVALAVSEQAAEALLVRSLTLVSRLPGVLAALEAGALHPGHLWCLLEHVAPIAEDRVRAEVEAGLLRWAAGRVLTPAQLAAKARREVAARDARAAARRLQRAIAERGVVLRPERVDGMAAVTAVLTLPEALALYRALGALADTLHDDERDNPRGDQPGNAEPSGRGGRTRGQKMADVLLDLVLRPGQGERPPVQVLLTVVAAMGSLLGGDTPGEVDGHVVPAEMIRHLLATLTGQPTDPHPTDAPVPAEEPVPADRCAEQFGAEFGAEFDGPLGPDPDPEPVPAAVPAAVLAAAWAAEDPRLIDAGDLLRPEDLLDPAAWADLDRWFDDGSAPDPCAAEDRAPAGPEKSSAGGAPEAGSAAAGAAGEGWWATADRAVQDASVALRQAQSALGHARRLVHTAGAADAAEEANWRRGAAGRVSAAHTALEALAAATAGQRTRLAALLAASGGGGLAARPRLALTDALSGTLLALTDWPGLRAAAGCARPGCRRRPATCRHDPTGRAGLGPPPPTAGYRPAAALDRWVRARDRRCRFPGCRRRVPAGGALDHTVRWPDGPTSAENLAGFCTTHHRGKHQAPGWAYTLDPDGTLTVTTPTGLTTSTDPPPY